MRLGRAYRGSRATGTLAADRPSSPDAAAAPAPPSWDDEDNDGADAAARRPPAPGAAEPEALAVGGGIAAAVIIVDGEAHQLCRDANGALSRRPLSLPARAVAAACSDEHYLVLTDDGDVHSAGNGGHGRLGHGSHTSNQDPKRIDALNRDG